jgi:hypothetical protein
MSVATTTVDDDEPDRENPSEGSRISQEEQDMLLVRWRELQHCVSRKEHKGDRVIFAERLRRKLEEDENT